MCNAADYAERDCLALQDEHRKVLELLGRAQDALSNFVYDIDDNDAWGMDIFATEVEYFLKAKVVLEEIQNY